MSTLTNQVVAAFLCSMTHDELNDELTHAETVMLDQQRRGDFDAWLETAHMVDAIEDAIDRRTQWKGPLPVVTGGRL